LLFRSPITIHMLDLFGGEVTITYTDLRMKKTLEEQRKQKARDSGRKDTGKF
jgi:hypothetical protein